MISQPIANKTRTLAEGQDEFNNLEIFDDPLDGRGNSMVSLWLPERHELDALICGGFVRLSILGTTHPPVLLEVQEADAETAVVPGPPEMPSPALTDAQLQQLAESAFMVLNWAKRQGFKKDQQLEQVVLGLKADRECFKAGVEGATE